MEAKNAIEDGKGQGMSDVATILARRVAVEFSDSMTVHLSLNMILMIGVKTDA